MVEIEGINYINQKNYSIFYIDGLNEEIQTALRDHLVAICYGGVFIDSAYRKYSYKNTVKEFIKRYESKSEDTKKGLIGELLIHFLVTEYFTNFETVTPFFNMEERSIKKGYDVVLTESKSATIWLIEVKSGELHKNKDADETIVDLLNTAKRDLNERLNEENQSLWQEAINGARLAYKSCNDIKDAVVDILENYGDDASDGKYMSRDKNIFISSVLFSNLVDCISEETISDKREKIHEEALFKQVFVLAVQKGTYQKVYEFLKKEAE